MKEINNDVVAIVGMACRLPKADNYNEYWENIVNGKDCISEIPVTRWDISKYYSNDILEKNKSISKWCGIVDDIDKFDNEFFEIPPIVAEKMDPQQRLLLEETYHCIEDSGISLNKLQEDKVSDFRRF